MENYRRATTKLVCPRLCEEGIVRCDTLNHISAREAGAVHSDSERWNCGCCLTLEPMDMTGVTGRRQSPTYVDLRQHGKPWN